LWTDAREKLPGEREGEGPLILIWKKSNATIVKAQGTWPVSAKTPKKNGMSGAITVIKTDIWVDNARNSNKGLREKKIVEEASKKEEVLEKFSLEKVETVEEVSTEGEAVVTVLEEAVQLVFKAVVLSVEKRAIKNLNV
jgi:hypothetical protein